MATKTKRMMNNPTAQSYDDRIAELINMAERQAINECEGMRADVPGLYHFAQRVKHYLLVQAIFGQWDFVGIRSSEGMANLKVDAVIDPTAQLLNKPPIKLKYDWSQTACPHIYTE